MKFTEDKMLPRSQVLLTLGVKSPSTLYELIRRAGFPPAYAISPGRKCWSSSEVQAWLRRKMADQRGTAA